MQAQNRMKFFDDKNREEREFQVGEMVYLKLQPFRQNSVSLRKNLKLSSRYYGPYLIIERIGKVAYKLDLPNSYKIHPVFHVSLLKKYLGKDTVPVRELPGTDVDGLFQIEPCAVLNTRFVCHAGLEVPQLLVQWLSSAPEIATWEDLNFLRKKFRSFDPCGQGSCHGGGIVMANMRDMLDGVLGKKGKGEKLGFQSQLGTDGGNNRCFK